MNTPKGEAQISGTVFTDYNASGTRTTSNPAEPLMSGVVVTAYNSAGTVLASFTTTSAAAPNYTIPASGTAYNGTLGSNTGFVASGTVVRVEFTNLPNGNYTAPNGTTNGSSVQFKTAGAGVIADFGINYPDDYCEINPLVITPCYINGSQTGTSDVFVGVNFDATGSVQHIALSNQIGSTWGVAYKKSTKTLFAAAVLKRHSGFGKGADNTLNTADDISSVYVFNNYTGTGAGTVSAVINLNSFAGVNVGANPRLGTTPTNDLGAAASPNHDYGVFGNEGKIGIGDIDISEDGNTLYVLNLNQKQLVLLDVSNPTIPTLIGAYTIPTPVGAPAGDTFRPWAIGLNQGKVYVGGVMTADVSQNRANLRAYVLEFNGSSFSTVDIDGNSANDYLPLNYDRTSTYYESPNDVPAEWQPWSDNVNVIFSASDSRPRPILGDIDFTGNGSMVLSFIDRTGMQMGWNNYQPNQGNNSLYQYASGGDLRQLCNVGSLTNPVYAPEGTSGCTQSVLPPAYMDADPANLVIPRFYNTASPYRLVADGAGPVAGHAENPFGGLAVHKPTNSLVYTAMNPTNGLASGGFRWLGTNTGNIISNYLLYSGAGPTGNFSKAVGLGDAEILCNIAPLEIGNRVWNDTDKDGVQDAGESGVGSVTIELYADFNNDGTPDGAILATTQTAADGTWYFNATNVTDGDPSVAGNQAGPQPNKRYLIRIGSADWTSGAGNGELFNSILSTANAGGAGQPDAIDNDATLSASIPTISYLTGVAGQNDHTLDFGFFITPNINDCHQSSTPLTGTVTGSTAGFGTVLADALDGNTDGNFTNGSVYHSLDNLTPFWQVDFAQTEQIWRIVIWNRTDCCGDRLNGAVVEILNAADVVQFTQTVSATTSTTSVTINVSNIVGKKVRIRLPGTTSALQLAEVQVFPYSCNTGEPCTSIAATEIAGSVWEDWNYDGITNETPLKGVSTVEVKAYDCNGNLVGTTNTDVNGNYQFTGLTAGQTYRIEFSLPTTISAVYNLTKAGTNSKTSVQFVQPGQCSSLGISRSEDYCQTNPLLATTCFVNGDPLVSGTAGPDGALITFDNNSVGNGTMSGTDPATKIATASQIGSAYGIAWDRKNKKMLVSAFTKRHAGFGALGEGGIYQVDYTSGSPIVSNWLDIETLGIPVTDVGTGGTIAARNTSRGLLGDKLSKSIDAAGYPAVGKTGLGEIEFSKNADTLFVVNLSNRNIYAINVAAKTLAATYPPPATTCTGGTLRPFALKYYQNKLYMGALCDGASSSVANMSAFVYRLDGSTWTQVFTMPMNYPKGYAFWSSCINNTGWYPWTDTPPAACDIQGSERNFTYPTPILSDIEFDVDGSMILAFMDRTSHQIGWKNASPTDINDTWSYFVGGDILRVHNNNGTFVLENNATAGANTTAGANNTDGPGGGEYYYQDYIYTSHSETAMGGLALLKGSGQVALTAMDPFETLYETGGVNWFNNATGASRPQGYYVYQGPQSFGKSAGLGDIAYLCSLPPIEIGNYVWVDADKDGVQDPCEAPLSNITVSLWKGSTQIASTTTNSSGEYYFSSKYLLGAAWTGTGADTTLLPNTAYQVRISMAQSGIATPNYVLTTANSTTGFGNDQNDSDASLNSGSAIIAFTTGVEGTVNHTYDFGFWSCPTITNPSATQTLCLGATGSNITVNTFYNTANGIRFVKFTSDQSATNGSETATELTNIYAGAVIATVTPTGASSPYTATYTFNATDFPSVGTYYVYAILNPDLGASCRPVQEIQITVNPIPSTPSVTSPALNSCPLTTVNLNNISAALTPSVSGGVFEWHTTNSSSSALVSNQSAVSAGTYYLFEKSPANCYSAGTSLQVQIQTCCPTPLCIPIIITRSH